ncbi:MAG TPA: efflux RND transporter periplasmic adaptor subunit [Pirellulales bacterium]|nr:efflux RND transporter periplasmic adaptor subunit [Pirellulales bacterium]
MSESVPAPAPASPPAKAAIPGRKSKLRRRLIQLALAAIVVAALVIFGVPFVETALTTVSTDDAYVNGHVTFVAPRIPNQVVNVLVDDNNRVHKGDILVQLDKTPYQVIVEVNKALVVTAQAEVNVAEDEVRGMIANARANRFKLEHTIESVNDQIAQLRATVAALDTSKARLARAKADWDRARDVARTPGAISQQEVDLREEGYRVAQAQVTQSLEQVYQIRVGLGLPAQPESGNLTDVPPNLDQNFSTVRQALADLMVSAAPLGITPPSWNATPKEVIDAFYKRDPQGNLDRIYAKLLPEAPAIKLAQAKLQQAQANLDQANLNLSYCDVVAEIDGVITRRNVNPGNNVQVGQGLMAIRSLTDIWIDANFKETQLDELRIGQHVKMRVDMYGRHHEFEGRISGFTMGTGSTLAILPAENATGNFIKVVQRLPVRIDPINYDPDTNPLFIGLSVVPHVYVKEPATGPDAGKFLQPYLPLPTVTRQSETSAIENGTNPEVPADEQKNAIAPSQETNLTGVKSPEAKPPEAKPHEPPTVPDLSQPLPK